MKKVTIVAGARPNFMKIAPIINAIEAFNKSCENDSYKFLFRLVHTGQHYDDLMSKAFFEDLNIPLPNVNLHCGGGSQAVQTAAILIAFERELNDNPADLVLIVGDVNSTMACAIVAKKANTKVAHVEAGIRSFDLTMPEEINRIVTDSITDYFFTTSETANLNLRTVGIPDERIFFVGNVMIDCLINNISKFREPAIWSALNLKDKQYIVMTMHRPANVDEDEKLKSLIEIILKNVREVPVLFPIHPRTRKIFEKLNITFPNLHIVDPMGYLEFNYLVEKSLLVITDSGGITEETTFMGIPCMTVRNSTERPETVEFGTNRLVGTDTSLILNSIDLLFNGLWNKGSIPQLWDGKSSARIVNHLTKLI